MCNKSKETIDEIKDAIVDNLWISLGILVAIIAITIMVFLGGYNSTGSVAIATCYAVFAFVFSVFILSVCFKLISLVLSLKRKKAKIKDSCTEKAPALLYINNVRETNTEVISTDIIEDATFIEEINQDQDNNDPNRGHTRESLAAKEYGVKSVNIKSHTYTIYDYITMKEMQYYILYIFHEQLHNLPVSELVAYLNAFYEFGLMKEIPHKMLEAELGEVINKGNFSSASRDFDTKKKIAFKKILKSKGFSDPNSRNDKYKPNLCS